MPSRRSFFGLALGAVTTLAGGGVAAAVSAPPPMFVWLCGLSVRTDRTVVWGVVPSVGAPLKPLGRGEA